MKKQNVIDLAAYREELNRHHTDRSTPASSTPAISDELKTAIELLIDRLRAQSKAE